MKTLGFILTWAAILVFSVLLVSTTPGCGQKLGTIEHTGEVKVELTVDTDKLDAYFARICCKVSLGVEAATTEAVDACILEASDAITACAKDWTADLLSHMAAIK